MDAQQNRRTKGGVIRRQFVAEAGRDRRRCQVAPSLLRTIRPAPVLPVLTLIERGRRLPAMSVPVDSNVHFGKPCLGEGRRITAPADGRGCAPHAMDVPAAREIAVKVPDAKDRATLRA